MCRRRTVARPKQLVVWFCLAFCIDEVWDKRAKAGFRLQSFLPGSASLGLRAGMSYTGDLDSELGLGSVQWVHFLRSPRERETVPKTLKCFGFIREPKPLNKNCLTVTAPLARLRRRPSSKVMELDAAWSHREHKHWFTSRCRIGIVIATGAPQSFPNKTLHNLRRPLLQKQTSAVAAPTIRWRVCSAVSELDDSSALCSSTA